MNNVSQKVAIVYDRVNKWGGAEKVLLALHDIFPHSPLYTSVYDSRGAAWAKVFPEIIPSFMQKIPLASNHHEFLPFLTPIAFESFNFDEFDAVISVTSADAKGIVTKPGTFHFCYCLTPTRYLWSHHYEYTKQLGPILERISQPSFSYLKHWDMRASRRPDYYASISSTVKQRIKKYYGMDSDIIYPPVDTIKFENKADLIKKYQDSFLYVGRFVPYKRPDVIIKAFNHLGLPLVMVGSGSLNWGVGSYEQKLKEMAQKNIQFVGQVSQEELYQIYHSCKALIFFHEEDFGIVSVEAQSAGKPVIALNRGGAMETVVQGKTGMLVNSDSWQSLANTIQNFDARVYNPQVIVKNARRFSYERFIKEFAKVFNTQWQKHRSIYS